MPVQAPASTPRIATALVRALVPLAERDEVVADLEQEFAYRAQTFGRPSARRWYWRQVLASVPALLRRSWWRGWSGF